MHELLRETGAFGVSLLAGDQEGLAQHFARGVPPIALWHGSSGGRARRPARRSSTARSAGSNAAWRPSTRPATTHSSSARSWGPSAGGARPGSSTSEARTGRAPDTFAVVELREIQRPLKRRYRLLRRRSTRSFDLDGVIDSEHVWDEARELPSRSAAAAGTRTRRDMISMSSVEGRATCTR